MGGSKTLDQLGVYDRLQENNEVFWHWREPGIPTLDKALTAQTYLSSANAITEDGQIINIDGRGNRLAAMVYGPGKDVYIVAGVNKIEEDFDKALFRARNTAAVAERTAKGTRRGEATGPERNLWIAERSGRKASARSHAERTVAAEFRAYREQAQVIGGD